MNDLVCPYCGEALRPWMSKESEQRLRAAFTLPCNLILNHWQCGCGYCEEMDAIAEVPPDVVAR